MQQRLPEWHRLIAAAACLITTMAATTGNAIAQALKADEAIQLRRSAYALQGHYFSQLRPMGTGRQPLDPLRAVALLDQIQMLGAMAPTFFPEGSDRGDTKASPDIWRNTDDFAERQQASIASLVLLSDSAQSGDDQGFRRAYVQAAAACKQCHDDYRRR